MVRIRVCQWSLGRQGPDALTRAAGLGFNAIHLDGGELVQGDWWPHGPVIAAAYAAAAADAGVTIVAVAPGRLNQLGLTSPVGSERARSCEQSIAVAIHAAVRLGAPLIYLASFANSYSDERSTEAGGDGAALTEFEAAIREGRAPVTSIQDAVKTMRLYQALWDAFEAGRTGMLVLGDQTAGRVSHRPIDGPPEV